MIEALTSERAFAIKYLAFSADCGRFFKKDAESYYKHDISENLERTRECRYQTLPSSFSMNAPVMCETASIVFLSMLSRWLPGGNVISSVTMSYRL